MADIKRPHAWRVDVPSLDGFTVGVTADRRAEEQIELLVRHGARVLHGPSVRTLPLSHDDELRAVTQSLAEHPPAAVLVGSGLGMRAWFSAADVWGIGEALAGSLAQAWIVARGPRADNAVTQAGLSVGARVGDDRVDDAVQALLAHGVVGRRIAVPRHRDDPVDALRALTEAGAEVIEVPVDDWTLPVDLKPVHRLVEATIAGTVHAITFTSAPAVRNFFLIAEELQVVELLRAMLDGPVVTMCVGPVCASTARRCGVHHLQMPAKYRLVPMVRDLSNSLSARVRQFHYGGHVVVLRGSVVEVDRERVELADREAGLLRVLTSRPGVALSKRELLHEVWGDRLKDDHVVEVTIARLRRRLGECSDVIVAVPRRGYRFDGEEAAA